MKFLRKTEIKLALFSSVIFLIKLYHLLNQSDANVTSTWLLSFSRASGRLKVSYLSSDWFLVISLSHLSGCCDCFGFKTLS